MEAKRTVMGNVKRGRRPYLQFKGVRYSSQKLRRKPDMIGKQLLLRINPDDLRTIDVFLEDGCFFDTLQQANGFRFGKKHAISKYQET